MRSRWYSVIFLLGGLLAANHVCAEQPPAQQPAQKEESSKVYRKFHPDGVVEFSDQPLKGAEELKVEEVPTYKFATPPPPSKAAPTEKQKAAAGSEAHPYTSLNITHPAPDETLRANDGNIDVKLTLVPELKYYQGHKFKYLLDGKPFLQSDRPATLKNVDRGTHTLVVQVIDKNNKVLIHSNAVTFHVKRYFKPATSPQTGGKT